MNAGTMGVGSGDYLLQLQEDRKQTDSPAIRVAALWEPQGEGT